MLTEIIRKHALKNRKQYGTTNPKSIIGKVIADFPEAKKDMKNTMGEAARICEEVNALDEDSLEKELSEYTFEEKKHEEKFFQTGMFLSVRLYFFQYFNHFVIYSNSFRSGKSK